MHPSPTQYEQGCNSLLRSGQLYPQCVNLTNNTSLFVPMASQLLRSNFSSLGGVDQSTGTRMLSLLVAALDSIVYIPVVSSGFMGYLDEVVSVGRR